MKIFLRLILIILFSQHSFAAPQDKIIINPSKITTAEFYEKYTATGQLKFNNSKDEFANVNGKVEFVSDLQGKEISKDEILIIIDKEIAEKSKSEAEAELYLAESNYKRDISLSKKKIISEEGINTSKATLEKAKNKYIQALNTYNDMVIKAPSNGYLGVIKTSVGDEIKKGDYLFSFTTKSDSYVFVDLPAIMKGKVVSTDTIIAHGDNGKKIPGKILAISDYVSNTGTVNAKFEFPYSEYLIHGSYIETEIIFNKHAGLAIPEKAVLKNNQGDFIYMITPDNKVKQIFVKLGIRTNNMIELISDTLKEGDLIVLDGLTKIFDGAEIIINETQGALSKTS